MLLPLDEVPVHVHRFAARVACDSKGSACQCGIHTAEAASALRSRKTERAAWHPNSPPRPGEALHPAPSARKSATRTAQETALCAPASTQEVSDPKIGQQLGAQPTPGFRVILLAEIDVKIDAMIDVEIDSRSGRSLVSIPN